MIKIQSLSKSYKAHRVIEDLNLNIKKGVVTGIAGPNACGKTTLIKCILGLVLPTSGALWIDGELADFHGAFRRKIGYMPQAPQYPGNLCLSELLDMLENLRGEKAPFRQDLISYFNLGKILKQPLDQLSGGTKQKVASVIAFMFEVPLIILDEPTVGLDPVASIQFKDLVLKRSQAGVTIVLVSHIMSEVQAMATEMAFMNEGKVVFAGGLKDLLAQSQTAHLEVAVTQLFASYQEKSVECQN